MGRIYEDLACHERAAAQPGPSYFTMASGHTLSDLNTGHVVVEPQATVKQLGAWGANTPIRPDPVSLTFQGELRLFNHKRP